MWNQNIEYLQRTCWNSNQGNWKKSARKACKRGKCRKEKKKKKKKWCWIKKKKKPIKYLKPNGKIVMGTSLGKKKKCIYKHENSQKCYSNSRNRKATVSFDSRWNADYSVRELALAYEMIWWNLCDTIPKQTAVMWITATQSSGGAWSLNFHSLSLLFTFTFSMLIYMERMKLH